MIVDDMEIMRIELKRLKVWGEQTGFVITQEAKDGQDAVEKLRKEKVDLVITDIKMPIVDGIELLKKIIDEGLCYCVVLLSEYSEFEYARQGIVYGAFDYIVKPIKENKILELLKKTSKYINKKKLEKEKIKKLENELEEKVEIFYTPEDVEKIVNLFKEVDERVVEVSANLIETIGAAVDYDLLKAAYVLKRITFTLIGELTKIYPWLHKFMHISEYYDIDFAKFPNFLDMKKVFLQMIDELITKIRKFQYGSEMNSMVRNICKMVLEHIDTEVSVKIIADEMFLNQSYLSTLYKEKTGISLVEYITMVKMERAKILLHDINARNYEIASKLGYKDVEYFSKLFKKYTGLTPSKFKANCVAIKCT